MDALEGLLNFFKVSERRAGRDRRESQAEFPAQEKRRPGRRSDSDRRVNNRFKCELLTDTGHLLHGIIFDLSPEGIGVIVDERVHKREKLSLMTSGESGGSPQKRRCEFPIDYHCLERNFLTTFSTSLETLLSKLL